MTGNPNKNEQSRRKFLQKAAVLAALTQVKLSTASAAKPEEQSFKLPDSPIGKNIPETIAADGHLRLSFDEERMVLPKGLQPSMLITKTGAIVIQAQQPEKPHPSNRMTYPHAMETVISRDNAKTWTKLPLKPGENGLNMEGGAIQLKNGKIIALDTYITPGKNGNEGFGQLYTSSDDWQTLVGPVDIPFDIPNTDFYSSKDDGGRPHEAERLHRRILELPNGDLLTTYYGHMVGDKAPAQYMPSMMKTRVMLLRSTDQGKSWKRVSTIAVDPKIGTEGFGEPVLAHISKGPKAGRLICFMRTGRELREAISDNGGKSWTPHRAKVFAGIDIYRTELWVDWLRNFKDFKGKLLDENNPEELKGAVVDPDLLELRSGLLVCTFGVRIPQKLCWHHPEHSWNGSYLAISQDHGQTWPNVVRLTSGVLTTHYTAIEETLTDNRIFIAYDLGGWAKGMNRDVVGRFLDIKVKS
ncbi:MAG: sialidase family protein [Pedobacter sp.]|nr:sialidase family protein [Pedobacter sp.]MDQ8052198.1 sialidase family protein [Pedobacter sp.]